MQGEVDKGAGGQAAKAMLEVTNLRCSYDGVLARTSSPAITAVDLHLGGAAARAVDLLVEELGGPVEAQPPALPAAPPAARPTLVVRASSQRGGEQQDPGRDREAEHAHP